MHLPQLPSLLFFDAGGEPDAVPERIEVLGAAGEHRGAYARVGCVGSCWKDCTRQTAELVADLPNELMVDGGVLPERLEIEVRRSAHCAHHGWHCPDWVESVLYRKV